MSSTVGITSNCDHQDGVALFSGVEMPEGTRLRLRSGDKTAIVKGKSIHDDHLRGVCVDGAVMAKLGADTKEVEVEGIGFWKSAWNDQNLLVSLVLSLLTVAGTITTALFGYVKNIKADNPSWVIQVAPFLLAVLAAAALLKLYQEVKKA